MKLEKVVIVQYFWNIFKLQNKDLLPGLFLFYQPTGIPQ